MRICVFADPRYLPPGHPEKEPSTPGSEGFFFYPLPLSSQPQPQPHALDLAQVEADLVVLPATLFLDLPASSRPHPCFAYGPPGLMAQAFRAGCTDFLREPWSQEELGARAGRLEVYRLRLAGCLLEARPEGLFSSTGELRLFGAEARAFRVLALSLNRVVPRQALVAQTGAAGGGGPGSRAADVLISSLRKKLRALNPEFAQALKAVRGRGYVLLGDACG